MKTTFRQLRTLGLAGLLLLPALPLQGQGTFQNLDFEAAQFVPVSGNTNGPFQLAAALPGWTGYIGGEVQTQIDANNPPVGQGSAFLTILRPPATVLQGRYAVGFGDGADQLPGSVIPVSLAQTGRVPMDARSLQFLDSSFPPPTVSLGGQALSVVPLGSGSLFTGLYGVDVSRFAGQTVELRFAFGAADLDDIRFSPEVIPEPGSLGLLGAGLLFLGWQRFRKRA